jgi:hypothetical protein
MVVALVAFPLISLLKHAKAQPAAGVRYVTYLSGVPAILGLPV